MAKIKEEIIIVRLSRLIKNDSDDKENLTDEKFKNNLEDIVQELVGENIIAEIEKGE